MNRIERHASETNTVNPFVRPSVASGITLHLAGMAMLASIHAELAPKLEAKRRAEMDTRLAYVEEATPDFQAPIEFYGEGLTRRNGARGLPVYDIGNAELPSAYATQAERETSASVETERAGETDNSLVPLNDRKAYWNAANRNA